MTNTTFTLHMLQTHINKLNEIIHKKNTQEFKDEWNDLLEEILLLALQGKQK
mgnify:CR=1 FL=1